MTVDLRIKENAARSESYLKHRNDVWRYLACVPPFTVMCIDVNGWMINERKLRHAKEDIVVKTHDDPVSWQQLLEKNDQDENSKQHSVYARYGMEARSFIGWNRTTDPQEKLQWIYFMTNVSVMTTVFWFEMLRIVCRRRN